MPCYHPLSAFQRPDGSIVFSENKSGGGRSLSLPCGRCVGCRLERSRQWATRCIHEAKSHSCNSFITLTYDEAHIPEDGSLHYEHFQKFMKRLRRRFGEVRFYMAGEYGEELERPHFHACLFGVDFSGDRQLWKSSNGFKLYRSPALEVLWPYGFSTVADLTFESAAYTARYVMKKITGDAAESYYRRIDPDTGEVTMLQPEFNRMSLKPGIGARFYEAFSGDVYPHDFCVVNGKESKPPRYYDKLLKRDDPVLYDEIKDEREFVAALKRADNTFDRLEVKEQCAVARLNLNKRNKI